MSAPPVLMHTYSVGFDNVQINVSSKHQNTDKGTRFLMWALCFAVVNRVDGANLSQSDEMPAQELPPNAFVPTPNEINQKRQRMVAEVMKILVQHLPAVKQSLHKQVKAQPPFEVRLADWPWTPFGVCANLLWDLCSCRSYNFKV